MQGSSTGLLSDVQADDEIRYWREQHRHGELGYCDFEAVPVATVRKVCEIFAAEPALSEGEVTRSVLQQLQLPAGSMDAALAAWLAARCWRRLHGSTSWSGRYRSHGTTFRG